MSLKIHGIWQSCFIEIVQAVLLGANFGRRLQECFAFMRILEQEVYVQDIVGLISYDIFVYL